MTHWYVRLKLPVLLVTAAAGTISTTGWLFLGRHMDGSAGDPVADGFIWLSQRLFGRTAVQAQELYNTCILQHKTAVLMVALLLTLLVVNFLTMSVFTRRLNQVDRALHQLTQDTGSPLALPRDLMALQAAMTDLQSTLQLRQEQARKAEQRKNDLLVFLAHDLKTPLTSVIGYLTLLRDDPTLSPQQRAKYTGIALDKALRLEELILEFFDITRESLHQTPTEPVQIHLSILLEQLADEFMPQFQQKDLVCITEIQPRLTVRGNPDKLARVFDNVLRNAVSYSAEGGSVEIRAAVQDSRVIITIRNEGLEIPEQELAKIFEKFYRLDSARSSRTGGAGLGLAIAREIVLAHGGSIRAESNGHKTAFVIDLPSSV